ncbi:hypothetical protein MEQU1_001369 [Malassezia equina]|uniref:Mtf2-like C-terminal domain-containing protein n=1 Tax=Malassezia equina TaxID=1381935 RepID=A0AAF0ECX7_9BASI|nr:hypothetical protein MEQU1_001369 [Malassezia equina]
MARCTDTDAAVVRAYTSSKPSPLDEPHAPVSPHAWDELFATAPTVTPESPEVPTMPRSVLYAEKRDKVPELHKRRQNYDTSALTPSETVQFRRIFELLEQEMGASTGGQEPQEDLGAFARRNSLAPRRAVARGGGVGTRFQVSQEGLAAHIPPEELDRRVDQIWEALQAQPSATSTWAWAETHIWGPAEVADYGPHTPFYAPALHMLLLTLRDRFLAPHTALAVLPAVKQRGAHSFVLGCTASLLAEVIRTQWVCLRDAHAVLNTAREARASGILVPYASEHAEDAPLREHMERVRSDIRGHVMHAAQARAAATGRLYDELPLTVDEQDLLAVASELRAMAGRTSKYDRRTNARSPRRRHSKPRDKRAAGEKDVLIYPQNPYSLLRSRVRTASTDT